MDNNQFDLDELLKNNISEKDVYDEIECLASDHGNHNFNDGFKQGFCFAVKSIKFLMKI